MNKKKRQATELQISSISHIHDPHAARKWMELYVNLLKKQLISEHADTSFIEE